MVKQSTIIHILFTGFLLFAVQAVSAQETSVSLIVRSGLSWQGQGLETTADSSGFPDGVSASQIINYIGIASHISVSDFLGLAPSLDIFFDDYIYRDDYGMAFPTQKQTGSGLGQLASTLVLNVNVPWLMRVNLGEKTQFKLAAGPGLLFRIPAIPLDGTENTDKLAGYLMGEGRWLNLYLEPFFNFYLSQTFSFSISAKVLLPIWHLWDSTQLPFYDTMSAGVVLGLSLDI